MKLETKNVEQLNNWIGAISKIVENITLTISNDGLEETAKDPAHVCLIDMSIGKDDFSTLNIEEDKTEVITVDTEDFSRILKRMKKDDSIEMKIKEDSQLSISSENGGTKEFSIPLLTNKAREEQDLSKLDPDSKVGLTVKQLVTELKNVELMGEHICLNIDSDGLTVTSSEGQGNYKSSLSKNDLNYIKTDEENEGTYQINYLDDILSSLDNSEDIGIALSNDSPLILTRNSKNSYFKMVQAPILQGD